MDDYLFWEIRLKDLIPTHHDLSVFLKERQDTFVEIGLQFMIALYPFFLHERLDAGIRIPLLALVLVTADVHVLVGKKYGNLFEENFQKLVSFLFCRVHSRIKNAR